MEQFIKIENPIAGEIYLDIPYISPMTTYLMCVNNTTYKYVSGSKSYLEKDGLIHFDATPIIYKHEKQD